jgi:hypothetical protein
MACFSNRLVLGFGLLALLMLRYTFVDTSEIIKKHLHLSMEM